jgi:thioredoxin 1
MVPAALGIILLGGYLLGTDTSSQVEHLSDPAFEETVVHGKTPVLVDFCATWCGPCRKLAPIVEDVSRETDRVRFLRVDVDQHRDLAAQLHVTSIPCLILFQDGHIRARKVGLQSKAAVESMVGL